MPRKRRTAEAKNSPIDTPKDEPRDGEQTPFERFEGFVKIGAVPKEELDEQKAEYKRQKKESKRAG